MPQGSDKKGAFSEWNIPKSDYDKLRCYIYRLGNLSILEKELNNNAGNHNFATKINFYKKSSYDENINLSTKYKFSTKDEIVESINKRGEYLAESIFNSYLKKL